MDIFAIDPLEFRHLGQQDAILIIAQLCTSSASFIKNNLLTELCPEANGPGTRPRAIFDAPRSWNVARQVVGKLYGPRCSHRLGGIHGSPRKEMVDNE